MALAAKSPVGHGRRLIHNSDGTIDSERTYDADPYRPWLRGADRVVPGAAIG
jgi:hypothetical protein